MKRLLRFVLMMGLAVPLGVPLLLAQSAPFRRLGAGLNYGGVQLDWRSSARWMWEVRFQTGKDTVANLETKANVAGLRTYRLFRTKKSLSPYLGLQISTINSKQSSTNYSASGFSVGGFGGLSVPLSPRFLLSFDVGPYFISLKEQQSRIDRSEVNFVGDTALIFFF